MRRAVPQSAARQGGVFLASQARQDGFSPYQVRHRVHAGDWAVVVGTVCVPRATTLTPVSLAWAGVLAAGVGGIASHLTAARLWGLLVPADPDIHVVVPLESRLEVHGLRTHRVPLTEAEICRVEGVAVTTLVRTVVDCLLWLPEEAGRALMTDALRRRLVTSQEVSRALRMGPRRHGLRRAWSVLGDVRAGAHSEGEVLLHRILRDAHMSGWDANVEVYDALGLIGVVDVLFAERRLVLEVDGRAFHSDDLAFQRDRTRQNRLMVAGYTVLRFTWADLVRRPEYVVSAVRQALAA